MDEFTRDELERELERDLQELENKKKSNKSTSRMTSTKKKSLHSTPAKKTEITPAEHKQEEMRVSPRKPSKKKITTEDTPTPAPAPVEKEITLGEMPTPSKESADPEETPGLDSRSRNIFIGTVAVLIILFLALFLGAKQFYKAPVAETLTYNGFEFIKGATHWEFQWQSRGTVYTVPLRYTPREVENITIQGTLDPSFNDESEVYLTFDPVASSTEFGVLTIASAELSVNLIQALNKEPKVACAADDGSETCSKSPQLTCENSKGKAVIFMKTQSPTGIFIDGTCIVVQGEGQELMRAVDRLLYQWYRVIN